MNAKDSGLMTQETACHAFMDSLVQSLFGISLSLESCVELDREVALPEFDRCLHSLHQVIERITEHRGMNCRLDRC